MMHFARDPRRIKYSKPSDCFVSESGTARENPSPRGTHPLCEGVLMRRLASLAFLALATLAAFPLSAHSRWHGPRRVVVEREVCRDTFRRGDDDRWDDRGRAYYHRDYRPYGCDDRVVPRDRVVLRPLAPPFQARVEFWLH